MDWRKAIELRHPSWYTGETIEMLDEYQATLVLHDLPKAKVFDYSGHSKFIYFRFHWPAGDYRGCYTDNFLKGKAELIKRYVLSGKEVYVYFNNTIGNAFDNARRLKGLINDNSLLT